MRLFLFILMLCALASASTHTWDNGGADGNGWNVDNYEPSVSDWNTSDLVFDNTSDDNVTFGASDTVNSITTTADYGGNFSHAGYVITYLSDCIINGTSTLNLGNGVTMNGASSTFHIGSGVGTVTASSCVVTMNTATAGVLDFDKTTKAKQIVINGVVSGTSTTLDIGSPTGVCPLIITAGSAFTKTGGSINIDAVAADVIQQGSGATLSGNFRFYCYIQGACTLPALTSQSSFEYYIVASAGLTLIGDITLTGTGNVFQQANFSGNNTLDLNDNDITCGEFKVGNNASNTTTINYGAGVLTCTVLNALTFNSGTTTHNLETATINVSGNVSFGSSHTVNPGTSTVTILNTSTITSAGKSFHKLNINASGKTITGADRIKADSLLITAGTLALGGAGTDTLTYLYAAGTFNSTADTIYSMYYDIQSASTLTHDASTLWNLGDGGTVKIGTKSLPTVNQLGKGYYFDGGTFAGFTMPTAGGDSSVWEPAKKYTFSAKPIIKGSGLTRNAWVSATPNSRDTIDLPAKDTLKNFYIRDQVFLDTCYCKRADTCLSGGGGY